MTIGDFLNTNANGLAFCWLLTVLAYYLKKPARPKVRVVINHPEYEGDWQEKDEP